MELGLADILLPYSTMRPLIENLEQRFMIHDKNNEKSRLPGKNILNGMVEPYYIYKVVVKIALRLMTQTLVNFHAIKQADFSAASWMHAMVAWAVQSQHPSLCWLMGTNSTTRTEGITGRTALSAWQSPSCPPGVHSGVRGRTHLWPVVQINDPAQVCCTAIWRVPKEKHYLLKFLPSRK